MMKTSSFFVFRGEGAISIARYEPPLAKGIPAYRSLAPSEQTWAQRFDHQAYTRLFMKQLGALDAANVWRDLHQIAGDRVEPILLCWCGRDKFCHRQLVGHWIADTLGQDVPELQV